MKSRFAWSAWIPALLALAVPRVSGQTTSETVRNAPWTVREVGRGVVVRTCHFDELFGGQQDVYVADADMNMPGVSLVFVGDADGTRKAVSAWSSGVAGSAAAVNGAWFNDADGLPIQFLRIGGVNLAATHPVAQERGGIVISAGGAVSCRTRPPGGWASLTAPDIMASEVPSVVDGQPFEWTYPGAPDYDYYYVKRAPRTAIGMTADNHVLLLVVDGRRAPSAIGVSYAHVAELMIALGVVNATVLDGGGSSTLWGRGPGVVNRPSDGRERSVALAVALVAREVGGGDDNLSIGGSPAGWTKGSLRFVAHARR